MENIAIPVAIIVALITSIVGPLFVAWAKSTFIKSPEKDKVKESIEAYTLVEGELEELFADLNCDRVWLAQFHNGGNFYPSGKSMIRFSFIFEAHSNEVPSIKHIYQNLPASLFTKPLNKLLSEEYLKATIEDEKDPYSLKAQLEDTNTNTLYIVGLFNTQRKFIGMLGIGFKDKYKLTRDQWSEINQKAGAATLLLENYITI